MEQWFEEVCLLGRSDFLIRYPHPFLLDFGADANLTSLTGETIAATVRPPVAPLWARLGVEVHAVRKRASGPFDQISLGRTEDNDIQLKHNSVSKVHAYLSLSDGDWHVADADSMNGTHVDGFHVAGSERRLLKDGCLLEIGERNLRVYSNQGFYEILMALFRMNGIAKTTSRP